MSSNVGLSTPRGSGTSGYVQRNKSYLRPRDEQPYRDRDAPLKAARQPDKAILEHERKRDVEVQCLKLQDELEEAGELGEDEIEEKVAALREKLLAAGGTGGGRKELKMHQVHELAEKKMEETERLRKALGIRTDYEEGSHWRRQEERKMRRRSASPER